MGRPLYSRTFPSTPAVREPEEPTYQRWSYLNAFDPDSDEFFANDNTVYEDFIGPVTPAVRVPRVDEEDGEEEEGDMVVARMGNASPISSESSLSDSDTPLAVGAENPAHLVIDALHDTRRINEAASVFEEPAVRVRLATRSSSGETRRAHISDSEWSQTRRGHATAAIRPASYVYRGDIVSAPTPSAPIPVPVPSRRSVVSDDRALPSPTTPPRHTPVSHFPMSPPPSSTPRLYSWARDPTYSTSPSSSGPLTNPHARTSYTHLSPAFIRIRDLTV